MDLYEFSLNGAGNLNFLWAGFTNNADVQLLNSTGDVLYGSTNPNSSPETINVDNLAAGNYAARVFQVSGNTSYNLHDRLRRIKHPVILPRSLPHLPQNFSLSLIDFSYVLTASHCVKSNNQFLTSGTFSVGGSSYSVKSVASNSAWNGDAGAGNDIAILQLLNPVSNVQPASLYSDFNENSNVGTYVGFGNTGNGLTGEYLVDATKRAGENIINVGSKYGYSDSILISDFSVPSSVNLFELQNIGGKCLDVQ